MRSVYVTGVAGFLGSHVARRLIQRGYRVFGCDNLSVGVVENVPERVKFRAAGCENLLDNEFLLVEGVIHCAAIARSAWPNEDDLWLSNVHGTQNVMEVASMNGIKKIVHASSSVVHHPDSSVYARTKAAAERIALGHGASCLRFGNIYGSGQNETGDEPNVIAQMRRSLREDGCIRVDGDGSQTRDFVHVEDAAAAVVKALERPIRTWVDICTGVQTSILDIATRFGCPIEAGESRGDPQVILQDPEPARWMLGWTPSIDIDEGLKQVIP